MIFTILPHSHIDVITNSSSELFVTDNVNSKHDIQELIKSVYPNYLNEYEEIKHIDELNADQLDNFFWYLCSTHCWPATKRQYPIPNGFTFEELYQEDDDGVAWNGEMQYKLKDNSDGSWPGRFITESNIQLMKTKLDPDRKMYFLYSIDENPNWEMQEELEQFMTRYHLG